MTTQALAYILLGVLVGIIFLLDGWRSVSDARDPLRRSPKIRGLIFVLGAGVIPAVQALLSTEDRNVIALYVLSFVSTTLLLFVGLGVWAFILAYKRLSDLRPEERRIRRSIEALPLVTTALQEGIPSFRAEIDHLLIQGLLVQRNWFADFSLGFFDGLTRQLPAPSEDSGARVDQLLDFLESYLQYFLLTFLERSNVLESFRGSIYFRPPGGEELIFLLGVSPRVAQHSRASLPLAESIAGVALSHPGRVFIYPADSTDDNLPFYRTPGAPRYASVFATAIAPVTAERPEVDLVLAIDAKEEIAPDPLGYLRRAIFVLGRLFAYAQLSFGVTSEDLVEELRRRGTLEEKQEEEQPEAVKHEVGQEESSA